MQPLAKPITINMVNDNADSQYELLWEANQDDLYILQPGEDQAQALPKRVDSSRKPLPRLEVMQANHYIMFHHLCRDFRILLWRTSVE
jgi:hypothetical protein